MSLGLIPDDVVAKRNDNISRQVSLSEGLKIYFNQNGKGNECTYTKDL